MPRRRRTGTTGVPGTDPRLTPGPGPPDGPVLTEEQVRRWAVLLAEGRTEFPDGLTPIDRERLLAQVRAQGRARLIRWIARALAWEVHHQAGRRQEDDTDG